MLDKRVKEVRVVVKNKYCFIFLFKKIYIYYSFNANTN